MKNTSATSAACQWLAPNWLLRGEHTRAYEGLEHRLEDLLRPRKENTYGIWRRLVIIASEVVQGMLKPEMATHQGLQGLTYENNSADL